MTGRPAPRPPGHPGPANGKDTLVIGHPPADEELEVYSGLATRMRETAELMPEDSPHRAPYLEAAAAFEAAVAARDLAAARAALDRWRLAVRSLLGPLAPRAPDVLAERRRMRRATR
jgi:hypothetical protein